MIIQAECVIPASQSKCFEAFSDLNSLADKVAAIKKIEILTSGSIGVGTKFKETRVMFGKESSEVMEITLFEPSSHIREEAHSSGMHYVSDWKFTEMDGQTRVSITFKIKAETILAKLMTPIFYFMAGSLKKAFVTDMEDMSKGICEI
jgi:ribosome-associated toxin RatA of RatAB toxin-antitoxin module